MSEPRITWRRAAREIARATGIAVILALAGLMVAVVVWQLAELIDILIR